MLAHVYRLISPITLECRSMKIDSDKTVQYESFSFVTGVSFSKRKSLATLSTEEQMLTRRHACMRIISAQMESSYPSSLI